MRHTDLDALAERVNRLDFDHPFTLDSAGNPSDAPGVHAPYVWHDDELDVDGYDPCEWEPITGLTGQYGYRGAVMHASEYVGCGVVDRLLWECQDDPRTFVMVVVEVLPTDDDDMPEPAGWAIMMLK